MTLESDWLRSILGVVILGSWSAGFFAFRLRKFLPLLTKELNIPAISVVIPARNEECNLPKILGSLNQQGPAPFEVIVVDDESTDNTAAIARSLGAIVVQSQPLPQGWSGKVWACVQGARQANGEYLLFLDADTWLERGALLKLWQLMCRWGHPTAISVLPYYKTEAIYEQLSAIFYVIMAMGSGSFNVRHQRLVGQSLFMKKSDYIESGGHSLVNGQILENFYLSEILVQKGLSCRTILGKGILNIRMFPQGFAQLWNGWLKSFRSGVSGTDRIMLTLVFLWISGFMTCVVASSVQRDIEYLVFGYVLFSMQFIYLIRKLGAFYWINGLLFPLHLGFYLLLACVAILRAVLGRSAQWRGRSVSTESKKNSASL